jgi:WD40 repeat protein
MTADEEYDAFISYRRVDGSALARWLQQRLKRFELPPEVVRTLEPWAQELHKNRPKIFLDTTYERPNQDFLSHKIYPALDRARRLIVISTPSALLPRSDRTGGLHENWLSLEISHYLADRNVADPTKPIDVVLGPGASESHFPGRLDENSRWDWIDLRSFGRWRMPWINENLDAGVTKLIAGLYDVREEYLPVLARQERARRNRLLVRVAAAATCVMMLMIGLAVWALFERQRALDESARADQQRNIVLARQLAAQSMLMRDRDPAELQRSVLLALEGAQRLQSSETQQAIRESMRLLPTPVATMPSTGNIETTAISPDGRSLITAKDSSIRVTDLRSGVDRYSIQSDSEVKLAVFSPNGGSFATAQEDRTAAVWDIASGRRLLSVVHPAAVQELTLSPDGKYLASTCQDKQARIWDLSTGKVVVSIEFEQETGFRVMFAPDAHSFAVVTNEKTVQLYSTRDFSQLRAVVHAGSWMMRDVKYSQDSLYIATAATDKVKIWEVSSGRLVSVLQHEQNLRTVEFSPDGKHIATGSRDSTARIWNIVSGAELARLRHHAIVLSLSYSSDGRFLATASSDSTGRVWEVGTGREIARLVHEGIVESVFFHPDNKHVTSSGADKRVVTWSISDVSAATRYLRHKNRLEDIAFSPDGKYFASADKDGFFRIWEVATAIQLKAVKQESVLKEVAFSPNGKWVATACLDGTATIFKVPSGEQMATLLHAEPDEGDGTVTLVAFSADSKYLVSVSGRFALIWEVETGRKLGTIAHEGYITAVAFSPAGGLVTTAGEDGSAIISVVPGGQMSFVLRHAAKVWDVVFSQDGKTVVTGAADHYVRTWSSASGEMLHEFDSGAEVFEVSVPRDGGYVAFRAGDSIHIWKMDMTRQLFRLPAARTNKFAISSDARFLATANGDNTAHVFELGYGKEIAVFEHDDSVEVVAFSPDDRILATGSWDKYVQLQLWKFADLIPTACFRINRNLTTTEWDQFLAPEPYRKTCPNLP